MSVDKQGAGPARSPSIDSKVLKARASIVNKYKDFVYFKTANDDYKSKPIDNQQETEKQKEFSEYLAEDKTAYKLSRGVKQLLWKDPCSYINAMEAFRISAYDEQKNMSELIRMQGVRDGLKDKHKTLLKEIATLEAENIKFKRLQRERNWDPIVTARSSGHPGNSYVYGYGYTYGIGYTDNEKAATAPGFELTATNHVKSVIKEFGPIVGKQDYKTLHANIFDLGKMQPLRQNKYNLSLKRETNDIEKMISLDNFVKMN